MLQLMMEGGALVEVTELLLLVVVDVFVLLVGVAESVSCNSDG